MIIKDYLDAVFMNTTEDEHKKLREEIYNNTLDELDDLIDQGIDQETAQLMIIDRLGLISKFRKSLGVKENHFTPKYIVNWVLLVFHIILNILSAVYSASFYIPGVNFINIFKNFQLEIYFIVIFILLSSIINLSLVFILLAKDKTKIEQDIHWSIYLVSFLTLPLSIFGIYPLLINKNKYVMHFFNIRMKLNKTKRKKTQLRLIFITVSITLLVLIISLIINFSRKEYLVEDYELLIFNYSDDINGINIYGSIQVFDLDENNSFIVLEVEEYFHSSNFPEYDNPVTNLSIIDESQIDFQEELILGDKQDIYYTATLNSNSSSIAENVIIEISVCSNSECSETLYSETFHAKDMEIKYIKIYHTKWIWN